MNSFVHKCQSEPFICNVSCPRILVATSMMSLFFQPIKMLDKIPVFDQELRTTVYGVLLKGFFFKKIVF